MKARNGLRLLSVITLITITNIRIQNKQDADLVSIDSLRIYRTEVTNGMYAECVNAGVCGQPCSPETNPRFWDAAYVNHPVVYVTWQNAQDYCHWAGGRLPTEAEWEWAARGDQDYAYPWGNDLPSADLVNAGDMVGTTRMVGMYPDGASYYGALDMAGNVREWVDDWYDEGRRVLKGGSFSDNYEHIAIDDRLPHDPDSAGYNRGFRCVVE